MVGLVEDGDLDAGQVDVALADEVLEPAGAGDEDVDAGGERLDLRVLADAAEDDGAGQAGGAGQRLHDGEDLVGELAGRHEHEGAGLARAGGCRPRRRATSGRLKARVLPLPVRPRPSTSRPASVSGSVATWIGKGASMPCAASAATSGAGTPSSAKPGADEGVDGGVRGVVVPEVVREVMVSFETSAVLRAPREGARSRSRTALPWRTAARAGGPV